MHTFLTLIGVLKQAHCRASLCKVVKPLTYFLHTYAVYTHRLFEFSSTILKIFQKKWKGPFSR